MSQRRFEPPRQGRPGNLESGGTRATDGPTQNQQGQSQTPTQPSEETV